MLKSVSQKGKPGGYCVCGGGGGDRRGQRPKAGLTRTCDHQLEMAGETRIEKSQTKKGG